MKNWGIIKNIQHLNSYIKIIYCPLYLKVINWRKHLYIPNMVQTGHPAFPQRAVSPDAQDLIKKLLCDADNRLGTQNGAQDIKMHPFFRNLNFRQIRKQRAPSEAIPKISHPEDTSNFDIEIQDQINSDDEENFERENETRGTRTSREKNLDNNHQGFYEFTFRRFFDDGGYPLENYSFSTAAMDGSQFNETYLPSNNTNGSAETPDPSGGPPPPVFV